MELDEEEHRRFFIRVDELDAVLARHASPHDIERCLQVIVQEAQAHFDHENRRFAELGYPQAVRHAAAHAQLGRQLWDALRTCYASEPDADWTKKGIVIKQMLLDHVRIDDAKYQEFLRRRA